MEREPFFNLKAVLRQTGLKADTLRAWERRYGLPNPRRSDGGHRLYTGRDIETIKWLMARQAEGLSISRAVGLWEQMAAGGRDPLGAHLPTAAPPLPAVVAGETVGELCHEWTRACLGYDEQRAEQVLAQAFARYSPETVALEVLQKGVSDVGQAWARGEATVQQEHFCSGLAARRLEALIMGTPPPSRPGRIVMACPPGEEHVISLLVLTFLLRRRGWEAIYLGANVPLDRMEAMLRAIKPQLVILAAQIEDTAAHLQEMAASLQQAGVRVGYGGRIFNLVPELRRGVAGHFLGETVDQALPAIEALLEGPAA
jgi:MerR family transcriptional regulator, light-induced transcriptional regulator